VNLKEYLNDFKDFDIAAFYLGVCLGLWPDTGKNFLENKGMFWTQNALGDKMNELLEIMVQEKILLKNDEEQYAWNNKFEGAKHLKESR